MLPTVLRTQKTANGCHSGSKSDQIANNMMEADRIIANIVPLFNSKIMVLVEVANVIKKE